MLKKRKDQNESAQKPRIKIKSHFFTNIHCDQ